MQLNCEQEEGCHGYHQIIFRLYLTILLYWQDIVDKLKEDYNIPEIWQGLEIHPEAMLEGRDMSSEYSPVL